MHVDIQGTGPSVVLIHGLGASLFTWRDVVAALAKDFKTYAVDLSGFGKTPAPPRFQYTMKAQADAVETFMASQGISNSILIGHSRGGGICLHLADRMSRAGITPVKKMVLIAPVAYPPVTTFAPAAPPVRKLGADTDLAHAMAEQLLRRAFAPANPPSKEQIDGYAEGLSTDEQRRTFLTHAASLAIEKGVGSHSHIQNETLLIWGEDDTILPIANGQRLDGELNNCTTNKIKRCGHVPHEELPRHVIPIIKSFL